MVSLILKEGCSKTKFRFLWTKTQPNHFLKLLTKFLKILENIAFAFITSHNRFLTIGLSSSLAVYFSIMDLEQSVKNLQAQNNQFQEMIFNLAKGQEELKALLIEKEKNQHKHQGGQDNQRSKPKRSFSLLPMPLSQVLQQLLNQNLITLLPPYSFPAKPVPGYKYHVRCAYHSNSPGHDLFVF